MGLLDPPPLTKQAADARYTPLISVRNQALAATTVTKIADYQTRPTWPAVVLIGDSISDFNQVSTTWNGSSGSRNIAYQASGYLACAMIWNRQQGSWIDAGIGGQQSFEGLARFDTDVAAYRPQVVIEAYSTNDIVNGRTATAVFADRLAMWRKAWAIGAKVIAATCPPRSIFTTAEANECHKLNSMLRAFAATNPDDFALVDWYAVWADPLTDLYKTGYSPDGTHPNNLAGWVMGKAFEAALDRFLPAANPPLAMSNVNDLDNLLTNPMMTGTGGTKTSNKGLTGVVADGWGAVSSGTDANLAAALSKVTRADGYGDWQQIAITTAPLATSTVSLYRLARNEWAVGDVIQGCVEFETDAAGWAPGTLDCQLYLYDGSSTYLSISRGLAPGLDSTLLARPEAGVLLTPPVVVPPGVTTVQMSLAAGSLGTTRFGRPSIRKLAYAA
jgi:lysophospholipase L1-like esterase